MNPDQAAKKMRALQLAVETAKKVRLTDDEIERIRGLRADGLTLREIQQHTGRSSSTISIYTR